LRFPQTKKRKNISLEPSFYQGIQGCLLSLSTNIYHFEEASADISAKTIMMDYLYSNGKIPQANYEKMDKMIGNLRSWMKENMKK
jgi:hypothetical protein